MAAMAFAVENSLRNALAALLITSDECLGMQLGVVCYSKQY